MKNNNNSIKKRNWGAVLYPESLPDNWLDILINTGLPFAISPLHDKDFNADGEIKKAHYHLIICYPGPTTFNVVSRITDELQQPIPIALESIKGAYRYFIHMDNPEKYQYDHNEIRHFNGFDPIDLIGFTSSEIDKITKAIICIIRDNHIIEYSVLMNYLLDNDLNEYFTVARSNTIFLNNYIKSYKYTLTS